jgi:hypothetical protein
MSKFCQDLTKNTRPGNTLYKKKNIITLLCRLITNLLHNLKEFVMKNSFLIKVLSWVLLCSMVNTFGMDDNAKLNSPAGKNSRRGNFLNQPLPPAAVGFISLGALVGLGWMFKKAPQSNLFMKTSELCSMSPDALRISLGLGTSLFTLSNFFSKEMAPGMKVVALHAFAAPFFWGAANSRLLELGIRGIPGCSDANSKDIAPIATAAAFGMGNVGVRYLSTQTGIYNFGDKV